MNRRAALVVVAALMLVLAACSTQITTIGQRATVLERAVEGLQEQAVSQGILLAALASTTAEQAGVIKQQRGRVDGLVGDVFRLSDKPVIVNLDIVCIVGSTAIEGYTTPGEIPRAVICGDLSLMEPGGSPNPQRGGD